MMEENERKRYLIEFNNFNFMLLAVVALLGIVVIGTKILGYSIDCFP